MMSTFNDECYAIESMPLDSDTSTIVHGVNGGVEYTHVYTSQEVTTWGQTCKTSRLRVWDDHMFGWHESPGRAPGYWGGQSADPVLPWTYDSITSHRIADVRPTPFFSKCNTSQGALKAEPTVLALGVDGGFRTDEQKYDIIKTHRLVALRPEGGGGYSVKYPDEVHDYALQGSAIVTRSRHCFAPISRIRGMTM